MMGGTTVTLEDYDALDAADPDAAAALLDWVGEAIGDRNAPVMSATLGEGMLTVEIVPLPIQWQPDGEFVTAIGDYPVSTLPPAWPAGMAG